VFEGLVDFVNISVVVISPVGSTVVVSVSFVSVVPSGVSVVIAISVVW
jgi:hypothetical protein